MRSRAVGLLAGCIADSVFADPPHHHPVAVFGTAATRLEDVAYRDARWAGVVYVVAVLGLLSAIDAGLERAAARLGFAGGAALVAAATWTALGGTSLLRTVSQMADVLTAGDVETGRRLLPSLCGRDPSALDSDGLARAALESVAENTSDAQVAPLFWAAVGGLPGALLYRAVNTLDSMVGYRSPRYARFGWAAARLDDIANVVPARVTGWLAAGLATRCGTTPQPQRRGRRGGLRWCARRRTGRRDAVSARVGDSSMPWRRAGAEGERSASSGPVVARSAARRCGVGRRGGQRRRP